MLKSVVKIDYCYIFLLCGLDHVPSMHSMFYTATKVSKANLPITWIRCAGKYFPFAKMESCYSKSKSVIWSED